MMLVVYVAGAISKGPMDENIRNAVTQASILADLGYSPIVPHLSFFWQMLRPRSYESWMEMDFALIKKCDAMLRIPGESSGADREVDLAISIPIPVFWNVDKLDFYFRNSR